MKRHPVGSRVALTPRELQVTRLVVLGHRNRDVAIELGIGEETVKQHLKNVFRKLPVSSRWQLAAYARANPDLLRALAGDGAASP